jgi:hypothetical protein
MRWPSQCLSSKHALSNASWERRFDGNPAEGPDATWRLTSSIGCRGPLEDLEPLYLVTTRLPHIDGAVITLDLLQVGEHL